MKIRNWEKWYWGIDLSLMILMIVGHYYNPESYKIKLLSDEKKRIMTRTEAIIFALVFFVGIGGLLWLTIRYFKNRENDNNNNEK